MKLGKLFVLMVLMLLLVVGCRNQDQQSSEQAVYDRADMQVTEEESSAGAVESGEMKTVNGAQARELQQDRMVIYQGNITIEVKDYHQAANTIQKETLELGGYVVESSYHERREGQLNGSIVVRVPKQYFHSFLDYVAESDGKVLEQQTYGNDITEEFVDLDSRLKSKRVVEERLLGFMEQADSTENLLKISNELAVVQEEIEQTMGRMQYLENQVDFSTITILIQERRVAVSSFQDEDSLNTWERSKILFVDTINVLLSASSRLIIFLIGLSPILIPVALLAGGYFIWKRKKPNQPKE